MKTILVAGANGKTGREIIEILKGTPGYKPLAMIRKEEQKATFDLMEVGTILADLEGDLREAAQKADKIIFAAGSGGHTPPEKTIDVDQNGAINLIDQAKAAGVKKFVMLSSMGTGDPENGPEDLQHYLKAKKIADDHLKACFMEYSIVRPGYLTTGEKTNKIKAKENFKEFGEISRKDVAQVLVDCLEDGIAQNRAFEILSGDLGIEFALREIPNNR